MGKPSYFSMEYIRSIDIKWPAAFLILAIYINSGVHKLTPVLYYSKYNDIKMGVVSILEKIVTFLVIIAFGMAGTMKIYPFVPEVYNDMREKFVTYCPFCPTVHFGYTPPPVTYMRVVGMWEILCALALLVSSDLKSVASFILSVIMTGAVYSHIMVNDTKGAPLPGVLMIMCLFLFVRSRSARIASQKQKND
ncbi:hypothetical protein FSP39_009418 [Pinctada imbricata]|uniref:Transmembrane protein 35A n=1 Tax=Pinctada imbricata TaxID=66713 RepID=A0AA88Y3U2_PINIB|nr:hypothetical protein FSP39_009418 [Pinctada imbricata]